ncbi:DUF3761 domain-containing protein [Acetobacter pasteurianus]|uniref:DUF3761 domain-containing protein n=1 Tax=Acetobacter pasteurianus TaxID=438 RepID=UPI00350E5763
MVKCGNGTFSLSQHHRGACSLHEGQINDYELHRIVNLSLLNFLILETSPMNCHPT